MINKLDLKRIKISQEHINSLPEDEKTEITIDIDEDIAEKLEKLSNENDVSKEAVINFIINKVLINEIAEKNKDKYNDIIDSIELSENVEYWLEEINSDEKWIKKPLLVVDYINPQRKFVFLPEESPISKELKIDNTPNK